MIDNFFGEYRFLSKFWPCDIVYERIKFPSTEHAFQAAKTLDSSIRMEIAALKTPGQAKRAGKKVALRPDWEQVKIYIMRELLSLKFNRYRYSYLSAKLIATYPFELIEGNTWGDKFWGVCDGEGENHLGKLLMQIRAALLAVPA